MDYKKVNLDGVEYQAEAQVITALTKAQEQVAALNSQVDQLRTDAAASATKVSTLEGERDSLNERLDAADITPNDSPKDPLAESMKRYNARMDSAWSDSNPNKEA